MTMKEKDGCSSSGDMSSAELRKIRKPIIERKRRERINESLEELKVLLLQAYNRHEPQYTKMEKADILEMAVEHLQFLRTSQIARVPTPFELAQRYSLGFRECVQEVNRCLDATPGATPDLKHRVLTHLGTCMGGAGMSACNNILAAHNHQVNQNATPYLLAANQRQDYNHNLIANQRAPAVCQVSPPTRTVIHVPKPIKLEAPVMRTVFPTSTDPVPARRLSGESLTRRSSTDSCHAKELKKIETIRPHVDMVGSPEEAPSTSNVTVNHPKEQDKLQTLPQNYTKDHNQNLVVSKKHQEAASAAAGASSATVARRLEFQMENKEASTSGVNRRDSNSFNASREEGKQDDSGVGSGFEIEDISEDEDDMWRPW